MTLTIEISAADEPRVTTAFGTGEDPRTPATAEELTTIVKQYLGTGTVNYEKQKAMADYESPPLGLLTG